MAAHSQWYVIPPPALGLSFARARVPKRPPSGPAVVLDITGISLRASASTGWRCRDGRANPIAGDHWRSWHMTDDSSPKTPEARGASRADKNDELDANIRNFAPVARIMKNALPDNAKIAKEAKECMQECVSEFISFITSEGMSYILGAWRLRPTTSLPRAWGLGAHLRLGTTNTG